MAVRLFLMCWTTRHQHFYLQSKKIENTVGAMLVKTIMQKEFVVVVEKRRTHMYFVLGIYNYFIIVISLIWAALLIGTKKNKTT